MCNTNRIAARRRNKTNPWFRSGDGRLLALDVLRKAGKPLTAREIAERMIITKGVTDATRKQILSLAQGVLTSLPNHLKTIQKIGESIPHRWALIGKVTRFERGGE